MTNIECDNNIVENLFTLLLSMKHGLYCSIKVTNVPNDLVKGPGKAGWTTELFILGKAFLLSSLER